MLSIQSLVAVGHVGNSAAVFPLQRLGHEVIPVMTVHLSNHTGYETARGASLSAHEVREVITGVDERGMLEQCDAVLSGYLGDRRVGAVVLEAVHRVKSLNPAATYCCDPVIGDRSGGVFVGPGIPEFIRDELVPAADIITPNHFELDYLSGRVTRTLSEVLAAVDHVRDRGPRIVLATSVVVEDAPPQTMAMLAVSEVGAWMVTTPLLPISLGGCGDLTAALFSAHLHETGSPERALALTTSTVFTIVESTLAAGGQEMRIVAEQDAIAHPALRFEVERLR